MKRICIESRFAAPDPTLREAYARYTKRACWHVLQEGNSPYASHMIITQVLDDDDPDQRQQGLAAGHHMGNSCDERWLFVDYGLSDGMVEGLHEGTYFSQIVHICRIGRNSMQHSMNRSCLLYEKPHDDEINRFLSQFENQTHRITI